MFRCSAYAVWMLPLLNSKLRKQDAWSIDPASGHGAHPSGFSLCIAPSTTTSGAIRVVGPYGPCNADADFVGHLMADATIAIEKAMGGYVVWGRLLDDPEYEELTIHILGSRCGFRPNITLRSLVLMKRPCSIEVIEREWTGDVDARIHRSFDSLCDNSMIPDLAVLDPYSYKLQLNILASYKRDVLSERKLIFAHPIDHRTSISQGSVASKEAEI